MHALYPTVLAALLFAAGVYGVLARPGSLPRPDLFAWFESWIWVSVVALVAIYLPLWFPEGPELLEGVIDLVFEEEGGLVLVDYKTDAIAGEHALAQAAHHAAQLQLYGRGLAQAMGLPVRERLVLFTALGQVVAV